MTFSVIEMNADGLKAHFYQGEHPHATTGNFSQPDYEVLGAWLYDDTHTPEKDPTFLPKEIPLTVYAKIGDEQFQAYRIAISWQHNAYFSETCGTCKNGVGKMMGLVDYLDNRVLLSTGQHKGDHLFDLDYSMTLKIKNPVNFRFVVIPSLNTWQDVLDWICSLMSAAIEGAHIKTVELRIGDNSFQAPGTVF